MAIDALRRTPLFADLEPEHLERLAADAEPMSLPAGEFLIREGDQADDMLSSSPARARGDKALGQQRDPLARVGPGAIRRAGRPRARAAHGIGARITDAGCAASRTRQSAPAVGGADAALRHDPHRHRRLRGMDASLRQRETWPAGNAGRRLRTAEQSRCRHSPLGEALDHATRRDRLQPPSASRPAAGRSPALDGLARADAVDDVGSWLTTPPWHVALVDADGRPMRP